MFKYEQEPTGSGYNTLQSNNSFYSFVIIIHLCVVSCYNFWIQFFFLVFDLPEFIRLSVHCRVQFTLHPVPVQNGFVCPSIRSLSSELNCTRHRQ